MERRLSESRRFRLLAPGLAKALAKSIQGEVRFDDGSRALYATDASNYRQLPVGVVLPRHAQDVVRTIALCREHQVPVLARGGGTSLAGQCCNVAVVLDFSKYMRSILEVDPERRLARVEPGVVLDRLQEAARAFQLTFAPDPSTHAQCTLGGMIGNNSCGVHSVMGGKTSDNVSELEVLTYDGVRLRVGQTPEADLENIIREGGRPGEIYSKLRDIRDRYGDLIRRRFPDIPRLVSGYNLADLLPENGFHVARALVGSEGTCVTILEATVQLLPSPASRTLVVLGYPDVYSAGDHIPEILSFGPIGLEGMDDRLVEDMKKKGMPIPTEKYLPPGKGWLLVEFGGESQGEADSRARRMMESLGRAPRPPGMAIYDNREETERLWKIRESGLGATARVPGAKDTWEGWEDSAVAPEKLGSYLRDLRRLLEEYRYQCALYGHFGQGCVHTRIDFDLESQEGIRRFRAFIHEAADLVVRYGGSFSGEHGDGQSRAELLPKMFGPELVDVFRQFKAAWDPEGRMNPGKLVDAYRLDENLRLGADYRDPQVETVFPYAEDQGSIARAALRCVGVGACRKGSGGVMCPSYRATGEEMHSTRGRAHLLFEMLRGRELEGWRDPHLREALDLCLACKACKSECPMNVDMATYKAEFLSHYYAGRLRPRSAYAFGLIDRWARWASHVPRLVNFLTRTPVLRAAAKLAAGIAQDRQIPPFARETFRHWFKERGMSRVPGKDVLLWPDTFTNYFQPEIARAAVEVLEDAGFRVRIPESVLCCGRPLYDYGMLEQAQSYLTEILGALRPEIRAGVPIVGLEPSCVAVFRDELVQYFPSDPDARRLSGQCLLLSEFLERHAPGYRPPPLGLRAIVQAHCHHRSVLKLDALEATLKKLGLGYTILDSGCCGMAGGFGFEKRHYDVSLRCGESVLLPAVRESRNDTLIIADGFSCREQIRQQTGRKALHLAQVLRLTIDEKRLDEIKSAP